MHTVRDSSGEENGKDTIARVHRTVGPTILQYSELLMIMLNRRSGIFPQG